MTKKQISKFIFYSLGILIIVFLGKNLADNWREIKEFSLNVNIKLLCSSLIIYIIYLFCMAIGWNLILFSMKIKMPLNKAIIIFYLSQLARYLPGGVMNLFGRVYLAQKVGIAKTVTVSSLILEMFYNVSSGFILAIIFLKDLYNQNILLSIIGFVIILIFILFLDLRVPNFLLNLLSKKLGNGYEINLKRKDAIGILLFYTLSWIIFGIAFVLFCNSLGVYGNMKILISIFPSSWIVGFLSPIPGGLGIREGVLKYFLSFYYNFPIPIIISLASRIWLVVGEMVAGGFVLLMTSIERNISKKAIKLRG
ncbi:MAG: glycosyltransferase 2 family protein [Thermosediminibacterales bacterium]|nr:glycosyltransferase 2 family protein [Thermosediminibacterales bacterium]MDK2835601.1 glycosyltransferase 2 family protein [Thermosediminibacterales bacterium]